MWNMIYEKPTDEILEDLQYEYEVKRSQLFSQLSNEIESRIKSQYLQRRASIKPTPILKKDREINIIKFQSELELEQIDRLSAEKKYWNAELIKEVSDSCKQNLREEQEQLLLKREKDIIKQVEYEKQEVISRLVHDSEEAVENRIQQITEDKEAGEQEFIEILKEECLKELQKEYEMRFREFTREKLQTTIEKEYKKNLAHRIEMELKLRLEDQIYQELNIEYEENHDIFRKKIEQEMISKLMELEEQLESTRNQKIKESADKKFSKIEKDLKINYLKKLDKLKNDLRKEFEEIYIGQIKKFRGLLGQEKSEAARIKSKINVCVKNTTNEKQSQLKTLEAQEDLLDRKIRDISIRQQYEVEQSQYRKTPDTSKSPMPRPCSIYSSSPILGDIEVSKNVPKPFPAPTIIIQAEENSKRSISPERKLLGNYDTKEIVSQLIMKNYEEAQKQAWTTLKNTETPSIRVVEYQTRPKSAYAEITELLSTGKSVIKETPKKHSLYQELLKKKYGVIEPRQGK